MKTLCLIMVLAVGLPTLLIGQSENQLFVRPQSRLQLEGTSTLHDYSFATSDIRGSARGDSASPGGNSNPISHLTIRIPVKNIKSGEEKMDRNMYESLRAEDFPEILYRLDEATEDRDSSGRDTLLLRTRGKLSVAGKEKVIEMDVRMVKQADGTIRVRGTKELLMTDFGIEPPSFMLGVLQTDDQVSIKFDVLLGSRTGE